MEPIWLGQIFFKVYVKPTLKYALKLHNESKSNKLYKDLKEYMATILLIQNMSQKYLGIFHNGYYIIG